jgi:hypothetical protein
MLLDEIGELVAKIAVEQIRSEDVKFPKWLGTPKRYLLGIARCRKENGADWRRFSRFLSPVRLFDVLL